MAHTGDEAGRQEPADGLRLFRVSADLSIVFLRVHPDVSDDMRQWLAEKAVLYSVVRTANLSAKNPWLAVSNRTPSPYLQTALRRLVAMLNRDLEKRLSEQRMSNLQELRRSATGSLASYLGSIEDSQSGELPNYIAFDPDWHYDNEDLNSELPTEGEASEGPREPGDLHAALGQLATSFGELEALQERINAEVLSARALGATWADIGEATGRSQQAANQRWRKVELQEQARRSRE